MKKAISVFLCLLILTLTGCKPTDPAAGLYGTWEAQIDLSSYLKERIISDNDELKDTLALSAYTATLTLILNEDGTYQRTVEGAFDEAAIATLRGELKAGYTAYYTEFLRENGMDMTIGEFEQSTGVSLEKKVAQVAEAAYLNGIVEDINHTGVFLVEEGVLYLGSVTNAQNKENGHTFAVDAGKLTLSDATAPTDFEAAFYPLTFEAVEE